MFKFNKVKIKEYIFIILTATIFFLQPICGLSAKENIFIVKDIKIEGSYNINFSREKFIDRAIEKSFTKLLSNILLLEDLDKLESINLEKIKVLIYSFKILEEDFKDNKYSATFEISYDDNKIKRFLSEKNISYYDPKNTTIIFFPILFIDDEIKIFNDNYFYKNWPNDLDDKSVEFLLPIEDVDDILSINKTKNEIENVNFKKLAIRYNIENYAAAIMSYTSNQLKVYLKTSLDFKEYNKNIFYNVQDLNDEAKLNFIIRDLKLKILDMWKRANLINIPLPLNILVKFQYDNLSDLSDLEKTLNKIHMINKYSLKEFDYKNSSYRINYSGDPKKLTDEFSRFNYLLRYNQTNWELIKKR